MAESADVALAPMTDFALNLQEKVELRIMLAVAESIVLPAIERRESRGAHVRLDYQDADDVAIARTLERDGQALDDERSRDDGGDRLMAQTTTLAITRAVPGGEPHVVRIHRSVSRWAHAARSDHARAPHRGLLARRALLVQGERVQGVLRDDRRQARLLVRDPREAGCDDRRSSR